MKIIIILIKQYQCEGIKYVQLKFNLQNSEITSLECVIFFNSKEVLHDKFFSMFSIN